MLYDSLDDYEAENPTPAEFHRMEELSINDYLEIFAIIHDSRDNMGLAGFRPITLQPSATDQRRKSCDPQS